VILAMPITLQFAGRTFAIDKLFMSGALGLLFQGLFYQAERRLATGRDS